MRRHLISISIVSLAFVEGYHLWTINERGFHRYLTRWFKEKEVDPPNFSCEMNGGGGLFAGSRAGTCIFNINPTKFKVLIERLTFESIPVEKQLEGCFTLESFQLFFSGKQKFDVYESLEPPGPINTSTLFKRLYFNKSSGEGCIDLEYPYG